MDDFYEKTENFFKNTSSIQFKMLWFVRNISVIGSLFLKTQ